MGPRGCRVGLVLLAGLMVAGCGAGQVTQTSSQQAAVDGAFGNIGESIGLRNVWIPFPPDHDGGYSAGSSVPVLATIVNDGRSVDELVAVTSPMASQVTMSGTTRIPPGRNVVSTPDPAAAPGPLVFGTVQIVLTANGTLRPGSDTPVTFRFREAGQMTLPVPMAK